MFMREFHVIDSAVSVEQLRMRLKDNELEQYGDAFIPEFVYGIIRGLPRFSSMRVCGEFPSNHITMLILGEAWPSARRRGIPGLYSRGNA